MSDSPTQWLNCRPEKKPLLVAVIKLQRVGKQSKSVKSGESFSHELWENADEAVGMLEPRSQPL